MALETTKTINGVLNVKSGFRNANRRQEPTELEDKVMPPNGFYEAQPRSVNIVGGPKNLWKHNKNQLLWVAKNGDYVVLVRDDVVEDYTELRQYSITLPRSGSTVTEFKELTGDKLHPKGSLRCEVYYTGLPVTYNVRTVRDKVINEGALWFSPYAATTAMRQGKPYYFSTPNYLEGVSSGPNSINISDLDNMDEANRNRTLKKYIAQQRKRAQDVLAERNLRVASFVDLGAQLQTNITIQSEVEDEPVSDEGALKQAELEKEIAELKDQLEKEKDKKKPAASPSA